jgi:hypothetical protein
MITLHTVSAPALLRFAAQLERDAAESLPSWIVIGTAERYSKAHAAARALRRAAEENSVSVRREILRNSGFSL